MTGRVDRSITSVAVGLGTGLIPAVLAVAHEGESPHRGFSDQQLVAAALATFANFLWAAYEGENRAQVFDPVIGVIHGLAESRGFDPNGIPDFLRAIAGRMPKRDHPTLDHLLVVNTALHETLGVSVCKLPCDCPLWRIETYLFQLVELRTKDTRIV